MIEINETIHQPTRTKIIAFLANYDDVDYSTLKKELALSDGHMSTHMKKLIEAKYVTFKKSFENNKPKTRYNLTKLGRDTFIQYLEGLKNLIS